MEWYISRLGNTYGPLTFDDLISRARDGRLVKDDLVWSVGMKKWEISEGIAGLWLPPAPPSAVMPTPPVDTPPKPLPPPIPEPTESIFAPSIEFPKTSKSPNFILRFWRGDVRLPVAYWVVGFLFTIAIMGLSNAFGALVESLAKSSPGWHCLSAFLAFHCSLHGLATCRDLAIRRQLHQAIQDAFLGRICKGRRHTWRYPRRGRFPHRHSANANREPQACGWR